jgi:hypothetical protein
MNDAAITQPVAEVADLDMPRLVDHAGEIETLLHDVISRLGDIEGLLEEIAQQGRK